MRMPSSGAFQFLITTVASVAQVARALGRLESIEQRPDLVPRRLGRSPARCLQQVLERFEPDECARYLANAGYAINS